MYVGMTNDFNRRYEEHTQAILKHKSKQCHGQCGMCVAYLAQARLDVSDWIMVPLAYVDSKAQALKLEKRFIYLFRSNLNKEIYSNYKKKSAYNFRKQTRPQRCVSTRSHATQLAKGKTEYNLGDFSFGTLNAAIYWGIQSENEGHNLVSFNRNKTTDLTNWRSIN